MIAALFITESVKLLLFAGGCVVFFYLLNALSSRKHAGSSQATAAFEEPDAPEEPEAVEADGEAATLQDTPVHPAMQFGDVLLRSLYFKTFDALTGPSDPQCFLDELTLECENLGTGYRYDLNYVVGTPEGLRQKMTEEKFAILSLPQLYAVDKYDLKLIRETLMEVHTGDDNALDEPKAESGNPWEK